MSTHGELERILDRGDWRALAPYLAADPGTDSGAATRAWYRERRAHWTREAEWHRSYTDDTSRAACMLALAYALDAPATAAARTPRLAEFAWGHGGSDTVVIGAAAARGAEWCDAFLGALAGRKVGERGPRGLNWMGRIGQPLIERGLAGVPADPRWAVAWTHHLGMQAWWSDSWARHSAGEHPKAPPVPRPGTIEQALRRDPLAREHLLAAIAHPRALSALEQSALDGWVLAPAVAALAADGLLDRDELVDAALDALTRDATPATQRALAKLLVALDLAGPDLADRLPLAQGILATARGAVTAVLLPAMLAAVGPGDLGELTGTVCARTEKAQRRVLLRALTGDDAVVRWGRDALAAALATVADVPDESLASAARAALTSLGVSAPAGPGAAPAEAYADLWIDPPAPAVVGPAPQVEATDEGFTRAIAEARAGVGGVETAMWDSVVRVAAVDLAGGRAWARYRLEVDGWETPAPIRALAESWTAEQHAALCASTVGTHVDRIRHPDSDWRSMSEITERAVHDVLAGEVGARFGELPYLLSTPTHADGTLTLEALVQRFRGYGALAAGPADLFLALARVGPVDPDRARELDGLSLPLWRLPEAPVRRGILGRRAAVAPEPPVDAADLVRAWIAAGGLPRLVARHDAGAVVVDGPRLPVPPARFLGMPASLEVGHRPGVHLPYFEFSVGGDAALRTLPWHADLLAARLQTDFDQRSRGVPRLLPALVFAPAPGLATRHAVAATLSHQDEDLRLVAAEAALTLMGRGRWSTADYTDCCLHLLAAGELRLARLAHAWEQVILGGGLKPLWPTVEAVVEAACALPRKPPGLPDLLALARRYAPSVPGATPPAAVVDLATARGGSRAAVEARAWLAAVPVPAP